MEKKELDIAQMVNTAVTAVGPDQIIDQAQALEMLDGLIDFIQDTKKHVMDGTSGPIGCMTKQFCDIQPRCIDSEDDSATFIQKGPEVKEIILLDYANANKVVEGAFRR